jgi:hypothetical protein
MPISRDDYNTWRANPVTEWAFGSLAIMAGMQREHWIETSWDQGGCLPELLLELRVRADAYKALEAASYEDFCKARGEEPQD